MPLLQEAAGYFKYLLEVLGGQLGGSPSLDVTPDCSEMLLLLCLAQAQECFFLKAQADRKNPALLARSGSGADMCMLPARFLPSWACQVRRFRSECVLTACCIGLAPLARPRRTQASAWYGGCAVMIKSHLHAESLAL